MAVEDGLSLGERVWRGYLWTLRVICGIMLASIVGVTLVNVLMRYVVGQPIVWADEVARLTFVSFTFVASGLAAATHSHLSIDSLVNRLPEAARSIVAGIGVLALVGFCVVLLVGGWRVSQANLAQASPALRIPLGWVYASIPAGALLLLISTFGAWRYPHPGEGERSEPVGGDPTVKPQQMPEDTA